MNELEAKLFIRNSGKAELVIPSNKRLSWTSRSFELAAKLN